MKIKSLTARISIVVSILTLFVLMATLLTIYFTVTDKLLDDVQEETRYKLDLEVERLSKVQTSVEQTAKLSVRTLQACMDDTTAVISTLNHIVESNANVNAAALAYAPNRLAGRTYYLPTSVHYGVVNQYFSAQELDGEYIYENWYIVPSLENKPFWTAPYYNQFNAPVVSYAMPVVSKERGFEGVLTLAVELTFLQKMLAHGEDAKTDSLHQDRNINVILDRNTTFLTTRSSDYIMNETLFTLAESMNDTMYSHIGREIQAGHDGEVIASSHGEKSVVSWRVLPKLDWTAMVITPYSDVYASVNTLAYTTLIVALLAAIAAIIILYFAVRRTLRPFQRLKAATHLLGDGRLDVQLPYSLTERPDEVGDLGREFIRMEHTVKKHIDELEEERQKLQRSYGLLSTLMHNVVSHLRLPINGLIHYYDTLAAMADDSNEAQRIKGQAKDAGMSILQQFNQLNELTQLVASDVEDDATMTVLSSDELAARIMQGAEQLMKRYQLTITKEYHDKRKLNIRSNIPVLEGLFDELIIETAKASNTHVIGLYFTFNIDTTAMRVMIEAKTDKPIPEEEKPLFFKRFEEQKVDAYASSQLLPLYICHRIAKRLGVCLFVEPGNVQNDPSNIIVIEIPQYVVKSQQ